MIKLLFALISRCRNCMYTSTNNRYNIYVHIYIAVYTTLLIVFSYCLHPMESEHGNSPERDFYTVRIEELLDNTIPSDPYRPLLYVLLSTLPSYIFNDVFRGGQLISTISSAFLLWYVFIMFRSLSYKCAAYVVVLVSLNVHYIIASLTVASDMLYAFLFTAYVYYTSRLLLLKRIKLSYYTSLVYGFMLFTRYNSIVLLPLYLYVTVIVCIKHNYCTRNILLNIVLLLAVLTPSFYLTYHVHGVIVYNHNHLNTALRMYSSSYSYTEEITQYSSMLSVVLSNPYLYIKSTAIVAYRFFSEGIGDLLSGAPQGCFVGAIIFTTYLLGLFISSEKNERHICVDVYGVCSALTIVGILLAFCMVPRYGIMILPYIYFISLQYIIDGFTRLKHVLLAMMYCGVLACTIYGAYRFIDSHPLNERNAVIALEKKFGTDIFIMGTSYSIGRYIEANYSYYNPFVEDNIVEHACNEMVDYIVIGETSLKGRYLNMVAELNEADNIQLVYCNSDVAVYRILQ